MSPEQLAAKLKRGGLAPAYLLLGADTYARDRCRAALLDAALPPEERENGLTQYDLNEAGLRDVVDDARSLSLFASRRLILTANAEGALPRQKAGQEEDDDAGGAPSGTAALDRYLKDPSPDVVLVFEAVRFDWEGGDDKKKLERIRKFYGSIAEVVELSRYSLDEARQEAQTLARKAGLNIDRSALDLLVESLGANLARVSIEIDKLRLYGSPERPITEEDIGALVPEARAATIFALVNALGRRDRRRSFQLLDTLVRDGEYLPMALTFLSAQFRMALASMEAGLRGAGQIQGYFAKAGVPIWGSRAEQVYQTISRFSQPQLERGLQLLFEADRDMRSPRPDDRIVMERLILELTG
ncbi:MAG: DNA polymerase III subunit delta [Acidobacteria bacterium]|nr:DNA polymerase III subunit delta [Acidobacteriota bacterium]